MLIFYLINIFNPEFSLGISIPDQYTDDNFSYFYQLEVENCFEPKVISPGIFIDYFYKSENIRSDPYFINSGSYILNAGGAGLLIKFIASKDLEFGLNIGFYAGEFSLPVVEDSGRIGRKKYWRNSLGATVCSNLMKDIGRLKAGIRCYVNLIPFGAKRVEGYWPEPSWDYYQSIDYASLNCVGIGLVLGLNKFQR